MTFTIKPRPTKDGFNLESEALSGPLWYREMGQAVSYALTRAGGKPATILVYNDAGEVIETIGHDPARDSRQNGHELGQL